MLIDLPPIMRNPFSPLRVCEWERAGAARKLVEIRMAYVEHKAMCPICLAHLSSFEAFCQTGVRVVDFPVHNSTPLSTSKTNGPLFEEVRFDESSRLNITSIELASQ